MDVCMRDASPVPDASRWLKLKLELLSDESDGLSEGTAPDAEFLPGLQTVQRLAEEAQCRTN
jgi:hypothetical protein